MKYGFHSCTDIVYTINDFTDGNCYTKTIYLMRKFYLKHTFFNRCVGDVQRVCPQLVGILHIETFARFGFDPPLFLITDSV